MTKSVRVFCLVLAVGIATAGAVSASSTEKKPEAPAPGKAGTITAWDGVAKTLTIKNTAGKELSFAWNERTRVHGIAKLGEHVTVSYEKDKDGKAWATLISVIEPKPKAK
jgi:hypothetical protein